MTRTKLELLKLLKEDFDILFNSGLCSVIRCMRITRDEKYILHSIVRNNRPMLSWVTQYFSRNNTRYYWKRGLAEPRRKWIDKMIVLHQDV